MERNELVVLPEKVLSNISDKSGQGQTGHCLHPFRPPDTVTHHPPGERAEVVHPERKYLGGSFLNNTAKLSSL